MVFHMGEKVITILMTISNKRKKLTKAQKKKLQKDETYLALTHQYFKLLPHENSRNRNRIDNLEKIIWERIDLVLENDSKKGNKKS